MRATQSDMRIRQNLALAVGLQGRVGEAESIVSRGPAAGRGGRKRQRTEADAHRDGDKPARAPRPQRRNRPQLRS